MVNVNTIYTLVASVYLNKVQSGAFTIDQFNTAILASNYDILNQRLGLPQNYTPGNPTSPMSYQVTQKITDDTRQFIAKADIVRSANGYFDYPSDYYAYSSLRHRYIEQPKKCGDKPYWEDRKVEVLDDSEFTERLESNIIPATNYYAIGNYYSYGIDVKPDNINKVVLTYVKIPVTPVWGYTLVNDQPVYASGSSTDFDYPVSMTNDIAIMVLGKLGLNLLMPEVMQYSELIKKNGV